LLAQIVQEPDGAARAALAMALAPIKDIRALPALLDLLGDPFMGAAVEAAKAIESLGPALSADDAAKVAEALRQTLVKNPASPGNSEFRESLVDAMAPLHQQSLLQSTFQPLLLARNGESAEMRRNALKGIGELQNPQSAATILNSLSDREPGVRLEAVTALGKLPNRAEFVETLRQFYTKETDKSILKKTLDVLESSLADLNKAQLNNLADRFKNEPTMRLAVLKELEKKLLADKMEDELADVRENIGMLLMSLEPPSSRTATDAAEYFRQALDFKKTQPVQQVVIVSLMEYRIKALLKSRQYHDAIAFAADCIREDQKNQPSMGSNIRQEAETLLKNSEFENARNLIAEAFKMNPPLSQLYQDELQDIQQQIQQREKLNGLTPSGPELPPETASTPATLPTGTASGR
jgi:tetratricopeptide (TPR) repeat protein